LAGAYAEVSALRESTLPEAARTFEAAREAYLQGLQRLTDVLDTERTLFELRARYVNALSRYHESSADIQGLLGTSSPVPVEP
jgi:cobalt-zinc-cadmium efflux system outer membrane protein